MSKQTKRYTFFFSFPPPPLTLSLATLLELLPRLRLAWIHLHRRGPKVIRDRLRTIECVHRVGTRVRVVARERGRPDVSVAFAVLEVGETEDKGCGKEHWKGSSFSLSASCGGEGEERDVRPMKRIQTRDLRAWRSRHHTRSSAYSAHRWSDLLGSEWLR